MGKLLSSKQNIGEESLRGKDSSAKFRTFYSSTRPILLTSIKNQAKSSGGRILKLPPGELRGEFAFARRPGFAMRTANKVAYGAGRAYGATSRTARKGFNAVRTRIPSGIKRRVGGIARKAVAVVSRIRKPRGMPRLALPPGR